MEDFIQVHRVAVRNAQKLREQAQRAFAHAEESLAKLVEKKGGEDAFENFYEQVNLLVCYAHCVGFHLLSCRM